MVSFARYRRDYEAEHPSHCVSWVLVEYEIGETLVAIGPASVPALIELLPHDDFCVRNAAKDALAALVPDSVPALVVAAQGENANVRETALQLLAPACGTHPDLFDLIVRCTVDEHRKARHAAFGALAEFGARATAILIERLRGPDFGSAAYAFSKSPEAARGAVLPIARALERTQGRWASMGLALANIGADAVPALDILLRHLDTENEYIAPHIVAALRNIGEPAREGLTIATRHSLPRVRHRAMDALSELAITSPSMIAEYRVALAREDKHERVTAAIALARRGAYVADALPVIRELLRTTEWDRQDAALLALMNYRDEESATQALRMLFAFVANELLAMRRDREDEWRRSRLGRRIESCAVSLTAYAPRTAAAGLHHTSRDVRLLAVNLFRRLKSPHFAEILRETSHAMPEARAHALILLADKGPTRRDTAAALARAKTDAHWLVRAVAAVGWARTKEDCAAGLPDLVHALLAAAKTRADETTREFGWFVDALGDRDDLGVAQRPRLRELAEHAPQKAVREAARRLLDALE